MNDEGRGKFVVVAIIWLMICAGGVVGWKYFFAPRQKEVVIEQSGSDPRFQTQVSMAIDSFSGYAVFRSPEFKEELAKLGIGLNLRDDKANYPERLKALQKGEVDLAVFTIDALIAASSQSGESPATIVMVIDETTGADAMVAKKSAVPNLDALNRADARIVATRGSPSETLARVVMAHFNLPLLDKNPWVDANGSEDVYRRLMAADAKTPQAFALWEPFVSKALEDPSVAVLIDSSKFRGYIVDVLVVRREYLVKEEARVKQFVEAYLRAAHALREQPGGMAALVAADAKQQGEPLTEAQAKNLAARIWWKNTQENYAHLGIVSGSDAQGVQHLEEMLRNITGVLVKTGAIPRDPTAGQPNKWYYDKLLKKLQEENYHPGLMIAGDTPDKIQAPAALSPLTEQEWGRLQEVGKLEVESIVFARGTSQLTDQSRQVLDQLCKTLETWPQYYLLVRGHSRKDGDPEANRLLSEARAKTTAEYIQSKGIGDERVRAVRSEPAGAGGESQTVSFVLGQKPY